jgi:hypothetical protein
MKYGELRTSDGEEMPHEKSELDNFSALTKGLLFAPKTEIDKRHKEWEQE